MWIDSLYHPIQQQLKIAWLASVSTGREVETMIAQDDGRFVVDEGFSLYYQAYDGGDGQIIEQRKTGVWFVAERTEPIIQHFEIRSKIKLAVKSSATKMPADERR